MRISSWDGRVSRCSGDGAGDGYGDRVEQGEPALLKISFGGAAAAYAKHRPDYAQAAVRWALASAAGQRVLDLGAGTGKLTATLVAAGGARRPGGGASR